MGVPAMAKKQNPFMAHVLSTWPQSLLGKDYLKGEEYDEFVAELVRRRDACSADLPQNEREKAEAEYREYANQFIQSNFRLILHEAKKYASRVSPDKWDDLISESVLGFRAALKTFDPAKGKIATHAPIWIRRSVQRSLLFDSAVYAPAYKWERGEGLHESNVIYLDAPISPDSDKGMELPDEDSITAEEAIYQTEIAELIAENLHVLDVRETEVVRRRFGLGDSADETYESIGGDFSLSRVRIRQIEKEALRKLRSAITNARVTTMPRQLTPEQIASGEYWAQASRYICRREALKHPCRVCGEKIIRGQAYLMMNYRALRHVSCGEAPKAPAPLAPASEPISVQPPRIEPGQETQERKSVRMSSSADLALGIVSDLVSAGHMESHDKTSILEVVQVVIASIEANMLGSNQ